MGYEFPPRLFVSTQYATIEAERVFELNYYNNKKASHVSISIIMPVYNADQFLEESLSSFETQSFKDWELICIDDGSDDSSLDILDKYARCDSRIVILKQENKGAGAARNKGMSVACGRYFLFADADDVVHRDMLETMYEMAVGENIDICACNANYFDMRTGETGSFIRYDEDKCNRVIDVRDVQGSLFQIINGYPWGKLFNADLIRHNSLFFQEVAFHNDMYFVIEAYARARKIMFLNQPFVNYQIGSSGSIQGKKASDPLSLLEVVDALRSDLLIEPFLPAKAINSFDEYCIRAAFVAFESLSHDMKASEIAYQAVKEIYLPKWGLSGGWKLSRISSCRLRFKLWCFDRTSFDGYMGSRTKKEANSRMHSMEKLMDGARLLVAAVFRR